MLRYWSGVILAGRLMYGLIAYHGRSCGILCIGTCGGNCCCCGVGFGLPAAGAAGAGAAAAAGGDVVAAIGGLCSVGKSGCSPVQAWHKHKSFSSTGLSCFCNQSRYSEKNLSPLS